MNDWIKEEWEKSVEAANTIGENPMISVYVEEIIYVQLLLKSREEEIERLREAIEPAYREGYNDSLYYGESMWNESDAKKIFDSTTITQAPDSQTESQ